MDLILVPDEIKIIITLLDYITEHEIHTLDNFIIHNIKDGLIWRYEEFTRDYLYEYVDNTRVEFSEERLNESIKNNPNRKYDSKIKYVRFIIYNVFIYLIRYKKTVLNLKEYLQDYTNQVIFTEELDFEQIDPWEIK
jgi:hypothetical protein